MKHQTGDWLAKWYCGNILYFHAFSVNYVDYDYRSQNTSPTPFNRRSINTVGSGAATNSAPLNGGGAQDTVRECTPLPSYA